MSPILCVACVWVCKTSLCTNNWKFKFVSLSKQVNPLHKSKVLPTNKGFFFSSAVSFIGLKLNIFSRKWELCRARSIFIMWGIITRKAALSLVWCVLWWSLCSRNKPGVTVSPGPGPVYPLSRAPWPTLEFLSCSPTLGQWTSVTWVNFYSGWTNTYLKMPIKVTLVSPRSKLSLKTKSTVSVTSEFEYLNLPSVKRKASKDTERCSPPR